MGDCKIIFIINEVRYGRNIDTFLKEICFFFEGVCTAEAESSRRTEALGGPNSDGTYDHGMFQVVLKR